MRTVSCWCDVCGEELEESEVRHFEIDITRDGDTPFCLHSEGELSRELCEACAHTWVSLIQDALGVEFEGGDGVA